MRTILAAMLVVAGVTLLGASSGSAAPANGAALGNAASETSLLSQIRYFRWHGQLCYHKCFREFLVGPRVCRNYC
jgi:hypothetical protein